MRRSEALEVMELSGGESEKEIISKYRKLALKHHPDKPNGTKEAFQRLVDAYELLMHSGSESGPQMAEPSSTSSSRKRRSPPADDSSEEENEDDEDEDFYYNFHYNFFSGAYTSQYGSCQDDWDEFFQQQRDAARRRYERQRRENLRQNYDYRDRRSCSGEDICSFCGTNAAITEVDANSHGIDWDEYSSHPEGYQTCWICKDKHISVMTESMAISQFAKKLEPKRDGPYGKYRFIFWVLRKEGRTFHHQPKPRNGVLARNSLYYWYPDLEDAALAAGWKPRGKKKEEVPWRRKDYPNAIVPVDQSASPKKKKRKPKPTVTPEKSSRKL